MHSLFNTNKFLLVVFCFPISRAQPSWSWYPSMPIPDPLTLLALTQDPIGATPVPAEALSEEEVRNVSAIPFATASSEPAVEAQRQELIKLVNGQYIPEYGAFCNTNNIPVTQYGQLVYMVARLVKRKPLTSVGGYTASPHTLTSLSHYHHI